jgi:ribosomal-protein-alanine N-acetyltransferase
MTVDNIESTFPVIETRRLILREITLDDLDWYFTHFSIPEIVEGTAFPAPETREAAQKEMERYILNLFREEKGFRWGITLKGSKKLIGSCGFYGWDKDKARSAEAGYDLEPAHWGKGIMTEALRAITEFGFEKLNLNRIQVMIPTHNQRSMRLVQRLGFSKEGVLRERSAFRGQPVDDVCFSLLRREWNSTGTLTC